MKTLKCYINIFRYLREINDMMLFYLKEFDTWLIGYADAEYLSDPRKSWSQIGYLFTYRGTTM